jgi:hypothetical protein
LTTLIPTLSSFGDTAWLRLFVLSYAAPTILTALVILGGDMLPRLAEGRALIAEAQDNDSLEIHYPSLER